MWEVGQGEHVALFIDIGNCADLDFERLYCVTQQQGELVLARAYGNFANRRHFGKAAQRLFLLGVQLIHCPARPNGSGRWKSTDDETLMKDVRQLLRNEDRVSRFIIASGDGDYVAILREIKQRSKKAIVVAGRPQVSVRLRKAADEYILLLPVAAPVPKAIFQTLAEVVRWLQRTQSRNAVYPSCVKQKMIDLLGEFDEREYRDRKNRPFEKFIEFLREAQSQGWIRLIRQGNEVLITTVSEHCQAA